MRHRLPKLAAAIGIVLGLAGLALDAVDAAQHAFSTDIATDLSLLPCLVALAILGPVIVRRQPENRIGRLFCFDVLLAGVIILADAYAAPAAKGVHAAARPHQELAAWLTAWVWVPVVLTLIVLLPIIFPTGSPATRRWRWAERLVWVEVAALTVGNAFVPGTIEDYTVDNPVTPPPHVLFTALTWVGFILLIPCVAVGALAVAVRYRRARGLERQQLKWLAFGAGVAALTFLAAPLGAFFTGQAFNVAIPIALTCVILTSGAAVLRYRLYDIDRLIGRTLSYGVLTVVLGTAYVGLVLAGQVLFSAVAGGSNLAVAASTLVVAALFLPLRARVQRFVDRRFYRRRYNVGRTLESFGTRLRQEMDLRTLSRELERVVDETMQPAHVSLWLRTGSE